MKREEIVQAERELDAVLELIQESEGISGRDDIKEERMKERNRIQEAEVEESLTVLIWKTRQICCSMKRAGN